MRTICMAGPGMVKASISTPEEPMASANFVSAASSGFTSYRVLPISEVDG